MEAENNYSKFSLRWGAAWIISIPFAMAGAVNMGETKFYLAIPWIILNIISFNINLRLDKSHLYAVIQFFLVGLWIYFFSLKYYDFGRKMIFPVIGKKIIIERDLCFYKKKRIDDPTKYHTILTEGSFVDGKCPYNEETLIKGITLKKGQTLTVDDVVTRPQLLGMSYYIQAYTKIGKIEFSHRRGEIKWKGIDKPIVEDDFYNKFFHVLSSLMYYPLLPFLIFL